MNIAAVLKAIYDCEVNCRIEWFWDQGFTWSVIDGTKYPRILMDEDTDGATTIVYESVDSMLMRSQPLPEKDWIVRGGDDDIETAVRQMAQAVVHQYPACGHTILPLLT